MTPEQIAALQAYRDARDPLKHYTCKPTLDRFHRSKARNKLIIGGNRSSKTAGGLSDIAMKARGIHPHHPWVGPLRIWLWCQSRSQAAAVVGRKLFVKSEFKNEYGKYPMIPEWEIAPGGLGKLKVGGIEVYQRCLLRNGSELLFGWSGVESSWARFQGGQYHIVAFDENSCEGDLLNESKLRVADEWDAHKETAPWLGGIYWMATGTQVDENFESFKRLCQDPIHPDYELFQVPKEESYLSEETRAAIGATLTDEQRHIRIDGDSTASESLQIYGRQWSDARHMRTSDYLIQPSDNLWATFDPGIDHPAGLAFAVINAENPRKLRFVQGYSRTRQTLEDWVDVLCRFLRGRALEGFVYDVAAHKTESTGKSVKNQLLDIILRRGVKIVRGLIPGRNRHKDGIARVQSYLDPDPLNQYAEPMLEFNCSDESGCQAMRAQMLKYRSYEAGKYTGPRGVVKKDDEYPDVVRYLVSVTPGYNPLNGCGLQNADAPMLVETPSDEQARHIDQMRRSKEMWEAIEGRDTKGQSVSLW